MTVLENAKSATRRAVRSTLGREKGERVLDSLRDARSFTSYLRPGNISSLRRLLNLKGSHEGERCWIFGNGPSLNDTPLELLAQERTFGLNRIYLKFDEIDYETSFLVSVNPHVIRQFGEEMAEYDCELFVDWFGRKHVPPEASPTYIWSRRKPIFSDNPPFRGLWQGATVTYSAMQLAYWMGFEEVILVGVDHDFDVEGDPHELRTSEGKDSNHFDPEYFGEGTDWQLPDLETSEKAYRMAKRAFEADGRRILDATIDGELDVFPKVDFKDVTPEG